MKKFSEQINERLKLNKDTKLSLINENSWVLLNLSNSYYYYNKTAKVKMFFKFIQGDNEGKVRRSILLGTNENKDSTFLYYLVTIKEIIEYFKRDIKKQIKENIHKIKIYEVPEKNDKDISKNLRAFIELHNKGYKNSDYWEIEDLKEINLSEIQKFL